MTNRNEFQRLLDQPENSSAKGREKSLEIWDEDSIYLLTRFVLGLAVLGSDELIRRLKEIQSEINTNPDYWTWENSRNSETGLDLLRYLTIGLLVRGQRRAVRNIRSGLEFSYRSAGFMMDTFFALTDNWLMRPVRRPVEGLLATLQKEGQSLVKEGRFEEQNGRMLAQESVGEIVDDLIDYMSENPELADLIREQLGAQSAGLAGVVVDNSRRAATTADAVFEGAIRRLFRLPRRGDLPQSPLRGKPQTMYFPKSSTSAGSDQKRDVS